MRRNTLYKHLNINNFSTYYYTLWQPWPLHFTEPTKLNYNSAPLQNLQVWDKASDRQSGWVGANPSRYGWVTLPQATCLAGLSDGTVGAPPFFFLSGSLNYARWDVTCNWDEIIPKNIRKYVMRWRLVVHPFEFWWRDLLFPISKLTGILPFKAERGNAGRAVPMACLSFS